MGTRSLTHVLDDKSEAVLVTIYRQFDGYPSGHGADLKEILSGKRLINGIGGETPEEAANGMGDLAAQIVAALKAESPLGGIYLQAPGSSDHWEEYVYTVSGQQPGIGEKGGVRLKVVIPNGPVLYEGPANAFDPVAAEKVAEED